jgi:hypothetical protein
VEKQWERVSALLKLIAIARADGGYEGLWKSQLQPYDSGAALQQTELPRPVVKLEPQVHVFQTGSKQAVRRNCHVLIDVALRLLLQKLPVCQYGRASLNQFANSQRTEK